MDIGAFELGSPLAFTVDSSTSTGTGSGNAGDLVYCIEQANANPDPAGSVIQFDPTDFATPHTITLPSTLELSDTNGPEEIDGPGANLLTLSGNQVGAFEVDSGVTASIVGLTISGSSAGYGGGIENAGTLTVSESTIADNDSDGDGGGIQNESGGTLTITNSTITGNSSGGNGAGVENLGALTITNSTITGNSGDEGGGIYNTGTATVAGSTIQNNLAGRGGGIENVGTLTIVNSTIAANSCTDPNDYVGGGIDEEGGTLTTVNCTIADNDGGGLYVGGAFTTTLDNTIIALNTNGTGTGAPADDIAGGFPVSGSNNLIGTGGSGGLTNGSIGNQVGVAKPGLDPNGLQWNGGPTQTIALMAGSPAIDAGGNKLAVDADLNPLTTDQRGLGFARVVNNTVDIGAFESGNPTGYIVNLMSDTGAGSDGAGDLLYCITEANANTNPAGSVIEFAPTIFNSIKPQTIKLSSTLQLTETAGPDVIDGPGASIVTISGNNAVGVFDIAAGVTASLSGLTISGGTNNQSGGGIENEGTLTVADSTIDNNTASAGGGINNDGTLTVTDSTIDDNSAPFGAGIYNDGALTVTGSSIGSNSASEFGGGVDNDDGGIATFTSSTIEMNSAVFNGGGVLNRGGSTLTVTSGTVSSNTAASGGGIFNLGSGDDVSTVTITDSTLSSNSSTDSSSGSGGGGLYSSDGSVAITGSTLSGNSAIGEGGGTLMSEGTLAITDSTLSDNSVTGSFGPGGGIDEDSGSLILTDCTIAGNSAQYVGAGIHDNDGSLSAVNCTIAYNIEPSTGDGFGGGMDITQGTATLDNTIIALNTDGTGPSASPDNLYLDGGGTVSSASATT